MRLRVAWALAEATGLSSDHRDHNRRPGQLRDALTGYFPRDPLAASSGTCRQRPRWEFPAPCRTAARSRVLPRGGDEVVVQATRVSARRKFCLTSKSRGVRRVFSNRSGEVREPSGRGSGPSPDRAVCRSGYGTTEVALTALLRAPTDGSTNGHRVACRRPVSGSGTEAREAATERAVLRMVALGVLAAQTARFRYADGWLRRLPAATTGRSKGASSRT
jgi:hypothetical protein